MAGCLEVSGDRLARREGTLAGYHSGLATSTVRGEGTVLESAEACGSRGGLEVLKGCCMSELLWHGAGGPPHVIIGTDHINRGLRN